MCDGAFIDSYLLTRLYEFTMWRDMIAQHVRAREYIVATLETEIWFQEDEH
jgi:hypothetical protein